jgi:hypothetical protein
MALALLFSALIPLGVLIVALALAGVARRSCRRVDQSDRRFVDHRHVDHPAASARLIARGPETMAAWATLTSVVAAIGGLYAARSFGTPAGPSIICFASAIFCVASVFGQLRKA